MKREDFSKLSNEELGKKLNDLKGQMISLKLTHKLAPIENPLRIKGMRKNIARLSTEVTKRETAVK